MACEGEEDAAVGLTPAEQQQLEDYQTMMGQEAGNLALALDSLSDVMAMLGLHKVYCRVEKGPRAGEPPLDLQELVDLLQKAKALVQEVMLRLREDRK
jgi:hypothetical protein